MTVKRKTLGAEGESLAVEAMERNGYRILERNFRNKLGEIDIVAKDGAVICFVEVKTRRSTSQGSAFEAVSQQKMKKLVLVASSYIKYRRLEAAVRFDVVGIMEDEDGNPSVEILKNAFDLSYISY